MNSNMKRLSFGSRWLLILLILPASGLFVNGCDNSIEPLDEERGIFSIYGALDMNSDLNYIRVRDLNVPIRDGEIVDFEGRVTLENLSTAETEELRDRLVEFSGVYVWNFESSMPIEPETAYQVAAVSPEGRRVTAEATTPNFADVNVLNELPDCTTSVTVRFEPLTSGEIRPEFGIEWLGQIFWTSFRSGPALKSKPEEALEIRFTPRELIESALDLRKWCHELPGNTVYVRFTHFGPDFFEDTVSDTLRIPGGAGNFGAYYEDSHSFRIDTSNVCFPFC